MSSSRFYNHNKVKKTEIYAIESRKKSEYNSEQNATSQLIEISNEYDIAELTNAQNYDDFSKQRYYNYSPDKDFKPQQNISSKKKLNEDINLKTQKGWQRKNPNYISGEEVCVMKKDKILNLSSFLIIQNDNLPNLSISPSKSKIEVQNDPNKISYRIKNSKNLINFIRKRNINLNQQYMHESKSPPKLGQMRVNMSCELKRQKQSVIKLVINNEEDSVFRSTSPNFKNKRRISNYIKFRMSKFK